MEMGKIENGNGAIIAQRDAGMITVMVMVMVLSNASAR